MEFTKMQGTGNDFVLINGFIEAIDQENYAKLAISLCDRHFGIGADGIMIALPSESCDIKMRIINADGSEAEMCGNGLRCFAFYVKEEGLVNSNKFTVETLAGTMIPEIKEISDGNAMIRVNMGEPFIKAADIPVTSTNVAPLLNESMTILNQKVDFVPIGMGNPHCVIFTDTITEETVQTLGPAIENNTSVFPNKTNVEFIQIITDTEINMRVWERGAAETLACGTGACASVVAGILSGKLNKAVIVHLLGGDILVEWAENEPVFMTGPAEIVFKGSL